MSPSPHVVAAAAIAFLWAASPVAANEICISDSKTFTVKVDIHASERGESRKKRS
jgi:pimeloyl-CoA synthetase